MYFSQSHEWVKVDGKIGTVGITDHAQKELGEIVFIELPKVGQDTRASEEICIMESTKAAADIYSPISGIIVEINETLKKNPSLINRDPEGAAWLYKLELTQPKELNHLMNRDEYLRIIS